MASTKISPVGETIVGPCKTCLRPLQRRTEIVNCKNGGHQACNSCISKEGLCTVCTTLASIKFEQEYLEKLGVSQLRQLARSLGMSVTNDLFQTQSLIDAILDFKNNQKKTADVPKAAAKKTDKEVLYIRTSAPRINIVVKDASKSPVKLSPTTPKSPGSRPPWSPAAATVSPTVELNQKVSVSNGGSPRKTSVNVSNYYQRQESNKVDNAESPKANVSQLRQNFEGANSAPPPMPNSYVRSTSSSASTPTDTQTPSPVSNALNSVEDNKIEAEEERREEFNHYEQETTTSYAEAEIERTFDDQPNVEERRTSSEYETPSFEDRYANGEDEQVDVNQNEEPVAAEVPEEDAEEEAAEVAAEAEHEDDDLPHGSAPDEDEPPSYEENNAYTTNADVEEAVDHEDQNELEKQVEDIVNDAADRLEDEVPDEE